MAMITFVRNFDDLSTDKGFQFKFYCDKCGNGSMSRFQPSAIGIAGSLLNAAGSLFGWGHGAGHSAYEIQRAIGGKAHDEALQTAVEEGKLKFKQCTRCGKWVCPEVCWNEKANQCEECAPDFHEQVASAQAQAKADAMRNQLYEKARTVDYASGINMQAEQYVRSASAGGPGPVCVQCSAQLGEAKFCPQCGTAAAKPTPKFCPQCGHQPTPGVKFCPECGSKF
ncbi:MAG: zinc ribbon domain-containing protein [Acidobacteria bacterium]|nr:zinc ribbon domain-containing protein [Acidobacteriota bacterium]